MNSKSTKKYVLVVNMHSRKSTKAIRKLNDLFTAKGAELKIIEVKKTKKLKAAFQKALAMKADVVVLGGGDGTLISGIEYLSLKDYRKPIGLLPLGTANYLVRNLGISLDLDQSIETLIKGKHKAIPVGVANNKFFALTFIVGITQRVSNEVSNKLKRKFGQLAYMSELIKQTKNHEAFKYVVESPSLKKPLKGKTHQILVYNSDLNLQLKLVPDHDIAQNSLKVVISRCGRSKLKLYTGFLSNIVSFGRLRPYTHIFEAQSLNIKTEPILPADFDGETEGKSPYEVRIYKRKVSVIC